MDDDVGCVMTSEDGYLVVGGGVVVEGLDVVQDHPELGGHLLDH